MAAVPRRRSGGHPNPKLALVTRGALEDGRSFHYRWNRGDYGELQALRLTIG